MDAVASVGLPGTAHHTGGVGSVLLGHHVIFNVRGGVGAFIHRPILCHGRAGDKISVRDIRSLGLVQSNLVVVETVNGLYKMHGSIGAACVVAVRCASGGHILGVRALGIGVNVGGVVLAEHIGGRDAAPVAVVVEVGVAIGAGPLLELGHHLDGEHILAVADGLRRVVFVLLIVKAHSVVVSLAEDEVIAELHEGVVGGLVALHNGRKLTQAANLSHSGRIVRGHAQVLVRGVVGLHQVEIIVVGLLQQACHARCGRLSPAQGHAQQLGVVSEVCLNVAGHLIQHIQRDAQGHIVHGRGIRDGGAVDAVFEEGRFVCHHHAYLGRVSANQERGGLLLLVAVDGNSRAVHHKLVHTVRHCQIREHIRRFVEMQRRTTLPGGLAVRGGEINQALAGQLRILLLGRDSWVLLLQIILHITELLHGGSQAYLVKAVGRRVGGGIIHAHGAVEPVQVNILAQRSVLGDVAAAVTAVDVQLHHGPLVFTHLYVGHVRNGDAVNFHNAGGVDDERAHLGALAGDIEAQRSDVARAGYISVKGHIVFAAYNQIFVRGQGVEHQAALAVNHHAAHR